MDGESQTRPGLGRADLLVTVVGLLAAFAVTLVVKQALVRGRIEQNAELLTAGWPFSREDRLRMGRIFERELRPLFASPLYDRFVRDQTAAFRASGQPGDESSFLKSLGSALEARGRARLTDAELATYQALVRRMVHASERACACNWDPSRCTRADVLDGIGRLSDEELASWYRLAAKASLAELAADSPVPSTQASFEQGLQAIIDRLGPNDRDRFLAVLEGRRTEREEQCFAVRTMLAQAQKLDPDLRARFTRALANLGNEQR